LLSWLVDTLYVQAAHSSVLVPGVVEKEQGVQRLYVAVVVVVVTVVS